MNKILQKEVNLSPPAGAKVKSEKSYISSPPACLNGTDKVKSTFICLLPIHTHTHIHLHIDEDKYKPETTMGLLPHTKILTMSSSPYILKGG